MGTIYNFKRGDEIVRVSPAKEYAPREMTPFGPRGGRRDRSYMGEKLIFVGIANGQIYLKRTNPMKISIFGDKLIDLDLDKWDEGWEYWFDPEKLILGEKCIQSVDLDNLKTRLQNAIDAEDYILAEKLQKEIDDLLNQPE